MGQQKLLRSTLAKHKKEEKLFHYTHSHHFTYSPHRNPLFLNDLFFSQAALQSKPLVQWKPLLLLLNLSWSREYEFSQKSQSLLLPLQPQPLENMERSTKELQLNLPDLFSCCSYSPEDHGPKKPLLWRNKDKGCIQQAL